tara:strand:+ start:21722 stop:22183 length:462 start_codon:yes stop_codon:yes gene_type:complete
MYNTQTLEDAGKAAGKLLSILYTNHNIFWLTLAENTHPQVFYRALIVITICMGCIVNHIYYSLWTLLFGNLTPFSGLIGFINLFMFTIIGYILGFEGAFYYSKSVQKIVDTREILNDLPKILKRYTYEVKEEKISKPIKKRSKSDNELDKKSL